MRIQDPTNQPKTGKPVLLQAVLRHEDPDHSLTRRLLGWLGSPLGAQTPGNGCVTYRIVKEALQTGRSPEKRSTNRRRTRLQIGKLIDIRNQFLVECAIFDRSVMGARLKLARIVSPLPELRLYDDQSGSIFGLTTIWQEGAEIGVLFGRPVDPETLRPSDLQRLRAPLYAFGT